MYRCIQFCIFLEIHYTKGPGDCMGSLGTGATVFLNKLCVSKKGNFHSFLKRCNTLLWLYYVRNQSNFNKVCQKLKSAKFANFCIQLFHRKINLIKFFPIWHKFKKKMKKKFNFRTLEILEIYKRTCKKIWKNYMKLGYFKFLTNFIKNALVSLIEKPQ